MLVVVLVVIMAWGTTDTRNQMGFRRRRKLSRLVLMGGALAPAALLRNGRGGNRGVMCRAGQENVARSFTAPHEHGWTSRL